MLRFIWVTGTILLSTSLTMSIANAQSKVSNAAVDVRPVTSSLNAYQLVSMAYRGAFRNQGLPSYGVLVTAHSQGQISARTVIQAAIDAKRLSPEILNDPGFITAVEANLRAFKSNSF